MNSLDKKIRETLRQEDKEWFESSLKEPSIFEMLLELFHGRNRWLNVLGMVWTLVFLVLGILSAFRFFAAETTRDQILWATAFLACLVTVGMLKLWSWLEMNKNQITREVKRLELQIAHLASKSQE